MMHSACRPANGRWCGSAPTHTSQIAANTSAIATVAAGVGALDGRLDTAEAGIAQNTTDIAQNAAGIRGLDTRLTSAETDIGTLDGRVTVNEADIATNTADIAALDGRVTVISSVEDRTWIRSAEALGAIAFIPKSTPVVQMQEILENVLTKGHWWPALAELPAMPSADSSFDDRFNSLSRQELRILLYIKEGRLNKQIADDLDIRESTVKTHITALLRKLNLRSRTQAAVLAQ